MIISAKIITRLAITPPAAPNTMVVQKLKNTISPKQKPVTGPPNFAQKCTTSIEFLAPSSALVVISP